MNITVRFFAMFREQLGTGERAIEIPEGTTARQGFEVALTDAPALRRLANSVMLMVNQEYVNGEHVLKDGDELAIIPPVSGGNHDPRFTVTDTELDPRAVEALVAGPQEGAIVTFIGTVRNHAREQAVTLLEYEAYDTAAEKMLARVGEEAHEQWPDVTVAIAHRTGALQPGEASVVIACASPHRDAAYEASIFTIARIKEIVPIWKKEHYEDGSTWVGSEADYQRLTGRLA